MFRPSSRAKFGTPTALYAVVKRMWIRLYPTHKVTSKLWSDFNDYFEKTGDFTDEAMQVPTIIDECAEEVSQLPYIWLPKLTRSHQNRELDVLRVWECLSKGPITSENQFVKLAVHISSVVANAAGCERWFSRLGRSHTKLRNKLGAEKVQKMAIVQLDTEQKQREAGTAKPDRKRKRDEIVPEMKQNTHIPQQDEWDAESEDEDEDPTDIRATASRFTAALEEDDEDDPLQAFDDPVVPSPAAINALSAEGTYYTFAKVPQPLMEIFNFRDGTTGHWDKLWKAGSANLEADLASAELAMGQPMASEGPPGSISTPSAAHEVVVID